MSDHLPEVPSPVADLEAQVEVLEYQLNRLHWFVGTSGTYGAVFFPLGVRFQQPLFFFVAAIGVLSTLVGALVLLRRQARLSELRHLILSSEVGVDLNLDHDAATPRASG